MMAAGQAPDHRGIFCSGGGPPPEQPVQLPAGSPGALCGLFLAACSAEASGIHLRTPGPRYEPRSGIDKFGKFGNVQ